MDWGIAFVTKSILLGVGLAMDAFSVSLANGLGDPQMSRKRMSAISGVFAGFQFAMPMVGWICVHTIVQYFEAFEALVPWIALVLLGFIGGKMLAEGVRSPGDAEAIGHLGVGALIMQGIATSIDALSVGFTISDYDLAMAFVASAIIAIVTFAICLVGLAIGKRFGTLLSGKAQILGGIILIAIGVEIFLKGIL